MTGFEPSISGFRSDRSTNWFPTTAQLHRNIVFLNLDPAEWSFLFIFVIFTSQFYYKLKKALSVVYGIRTRGGRIVGADGSTEL